MAYSGYLIKVGTGGGAYTIPLEFMRYETYQVTYYVQDLDSYRDANGELHRNALTSKVGKVEFNTPIINNSDFETLMSNIRSQYSDANEKRLTATFYVPEINDYVTQSMYVPDVVTKIRNVNENNNTISYTETRIAFIGYGD